MIVKRAVKEDALSLFNLIDNCRGYLREWLPWVDTTISAGETLLFIKENESKDLFSGREVYSIKYNGVTAGMIDLHNGDRFNAKAELGYWIGEQFQGKGIVRNACISLIDKAFDDYNLNRVTIKAAVQNIKSRNVAEKLKFILEGIERDGEFLNGSFVDLAVYSLLNKDWPAIRNSL